ncbi:polyprenyl synthetase family protein [Geoalkalibacter halelectricus]|uniref:Polyprenyl synthetase family protein n=1 Tax=Geoalkalibacter halelectricus TaxID=2847045 RepID=A0ABY5ZR54_9BACT|nr:farnesyl diphosphate synthase [Geoalkalibacter halelectricus]MDO3376937.1 polyprenyl synthetase family protein [Geoalkalibacter halelectricus]UWZ81161.1 polyprenyl synthetase family protein [Geoalkalibacter halelectricus]
MDLKIYLKDQAALVDAALDRYLPGADTLPEKLHQAMRYSVMAGGKRIRPILVLAACRAVGGREELALPAACALEMIHTYSLIHDDLPAMDDDDFRRGRPTNHKVYGEATAILAGDALLTEAFELLCDRALNREVPAETLLRVSNIIARCAGSTGMVGGQVVDMESEGKDIDFPTVEYIHTRKTGALMLASVQCGALLGGADEQAFAALTRYGSAAGLAFQVADDILNLVSDSQTLGKTAGSDAVRGKATYPALIGLEASRDRARELKDLALDAIAPLGGPAEPLRAIARFIIERSS